MRLSDRATANTLYNDTDEMQESVARMLKNEEVKVAKMGDYLV